MGRAGKSLKQVLESHGISQNKLAVAMGVRASVIYRWVHELADPTGDTITEIVKALNEINSAAAKQFIELYLGELVDNHSAEDHGDGEN